jgi:small-conductance mechanosensitive channel
MDTIDTILERMTILWGNLSELFAIPLFSFGSTSITLSLIFYLLLFSFLLLFVARKLRNVLVNRILSKYGLEYGTSKSIGTIFYYFLTVIGFFVIIQATGIDLTGLNLIAGALGVGIGFGLQNITNNFISGIIILFERPIKEGDRIEVGDIRGDVVKISARSTTILTNDNITIIVPNSEFINSKVINWSHNDRNVRFQFPVGVAYKEDPKLIRKLLIDVSSENNGILKKPSPEVLFEDFGDSSLNFKLAVWTTDYIDKPNILKSQLYFAIFKKFRENNIEIPFPQRDLHLKSGFELPNDAPSDKA